MFKYADANHNIIESDEGFSVENKGINTIVYRESVRSLALYKEFIAGSTDAFIGGEIDKWDNGELITPQSRDRILDNIRKAFAFKGSKVNFRIGSGFYIDGKSVLPPGWQGRC